MQPPPPPVVVDGDEEYEIEKIVAKRKRYGKKQYIVKWVSYPLDEKSDWINEDGLCHAKELLKEYTSNNTQPASKRRKRK